MKIYFLLLFYHPDFQYFPANYQARYMKEKYDVDISDQTLRNWKKKLLNKNLIAFDSDDFKTYACNRGKAPREISEEDYNKAWREFYSRFAAGENPNDLRIEIYYKNNGMPRKQIGICENAIEHETLSELHRILENLPEYQKIIQKPDGI